MTFLEEQLIDMVEGLIDENMDMIKWARYVKEAKELLAAVNDDRGNEP